MGGIRVQACITLQGTLATFEGTLNNYQTITLGVDTIRVSSVIGNSTVVGCAGASNVSLAKGTYKSYFCSARIVSGYKYSTKVSAVWGNTSVSLQSPKLTG